LEQQAEPGAVDAAVVGGDLQLVGALLQQGVDQEPRDPREPETAHGDLAAAADVGDSLGGGADDLVDGHTHVDSPRVWASSRWATIAGLMTSGCSSLARWAES